MTFRWTRGLSHWTWVAQKAHFTQAEHHPWDMVFMKFPGRAMGHGLPPCYWPKHLLTHRPNVALDALVGAHIHVQLPPPARTCHQQVMESSHLMFKS